MNQQRYTWEAGPDRPDLWSDSNWATFDRLVATSPGWAKAAYNPEFFGLTPSVVDWIAFGLDQGATARYRPSGGEDSTRTVLLSFEEWDLTLEAPGPRRTGPIWLSTAVGPLRESREMDRMLADFSASAPILRRIHRSAGGVTVELSVSFTTDFPADMAILDQARRDLAAQGAEVADLAYGDLLDACVRATLAAPPIPDRMQQQIRRLDGWVWSTRPADRVDAFQEYLLHDWTQQPAEDFVTLTHAGHGVSSYGLTLSMAYGPVALMVQGAWGGAFGGPLDNGRLAELYAHVAAVVRAVDERQPPPYTAPRRRPLSIVYSNFRDDLAAHRWDNVNRRYTDLELPDRDAWEPLIALAAGIAMPR